MMRLSMARRTKPWRRACAFMVCLAVALWAVVPLPPHVPTLFDTLQEHAAFIAEHGHSHGFEEDLAAAMHGHSHDAMEHDHSVATLSLVPRTQITCFGRDLDRPRPSWACSGIVPRIERPPRV